MVTKDQVEATITELEENEYWRRGDFSSNHETLRTYIAQLEAEIARKDEALEWINANWANQDMSHTDFRVKAYIEARGALAPASTEGGAS
jgi:hypothetical protein